LEGVAGDVILRRIVLLGAFAGLRKNEIVNARWDWFDFGVQARPVIHVRSFDGFDLKDYEDRSIPMHRKIVEEFGQDSPCEGFVFVSPRAGDGKAQYRFDPKKGLQKALREAGLTTEQPFQMLRHTFGSLLWEERLRPLCGILFWDVILCTDYSGRGVVPVQGYQRHF
jgi:integrase